MNIPKILIAFFIIIVIAISSAIFTIMKMKELSDNTQQMYTHPFQVSNAVANMETSIVTINKNMKDVILFYNTYEMIQTIENIQKEEEKIHQYFTIIKKYYLGNQKDVNNVYKTFKAWKPIRDKILSLIYDKKIEEALKIARTKDSNHVNYLEKEIEVLKEYAFNKANTFYNLSINNNNMKYVIIVFILTLIISISIVYFITVNLFRIGKINNKQLHLIDQNILMATISLDKKITFISNALCHLLNKNKTALVNTTNNYFFCDEEQFEKFENKIFLGKEHKGEIYLILNNEKIWFEIEIYPELNQNFKLTAFNIFLTNIHDKKRIEKISITDKLTNLYNRNYFELIFEKEVKRSKRDEKALSMIMFDIDFFKQFNDTYGHQEGDAALKEVARVLFSHTNRSYDYAFRMGGEEFVIITYDKNMETLNKLTQDILDQVSQLKISHKKSQVSNYLTISAGAVLFKNTHLLTQEEMYKKIDSLLYNAKNDGRNCFKSEFIE